MILTLTPNPSLDLLFRAERLVWDDANRLPMPRRRAGGQGINLARAVRALDPSQDVLAIAALGGDAGAELEAALAAEGTPLRPVRIDGDTRVFVGVREDDGRSMLLNPRGPEVGAAVAESLLEAVRAELGDVPSAARSAWLACCGSVLPGLPADLYARAARLARKRGHRVVVDCDGDALRLAAGAGCDLLVPNVHEAGRLLGVEIDGCEAAARAAVRLVGSGVPIVAVTLGADGAVAASPDGVWRARPSLEPSLAAECAEGSAVGAGDAFLAGLILGLRAERPLAESLRQGVAAGTATLLGRGTDLVRRADFERVLPSIRVGPISPGR